ncbi:hypothetical protein PHYSODRAFT_310637 [Phytophthora sojae]|uniref:Uncharacterized protein n=1 Tax=Phytophthora sojae (strain P6497) TaxID=1094619 RepID=G4YTE0_PHYSP|nr:hypothetical protein PHYSODRAFT_310637 [Phytophthora sojae]EGZ23062.1 hypothetical protein PHYSODRAFT_310637 [Phytophthora sojae]|eukprot:XP_009518350.1 hypothetical protein PHYSODRAFT_310637 [Phytophthora sojae]
MGAAGSIETTPYDEAKFLQSKAVMESAAEDADKFAKLKSIWANGTPPAAAAPATDAAPAADAHRKSVKELPTAAAHEGHKENGHAHEENGHHAHGENGENGHAHKEGDHHHKEDGHAHKEGDHHHDHAHKDGEHHHKEGEHHGDHHHKDDHHDHKKEETHAHKEEAHKEEAHAPKEDGHAEAPKEALKVPSASASTSKLPGAPSEHHDEKLSKEA